MLDMQQGGRVAEAIAAVANSLTGHSSETLDTLERVCVIDGIEHFAYQEAQTRAHAAGRITHGEALVVYAALGASWSPDNGGWSDEVDLPTKIAVTKLVSELMGA